MALKKESTRKAHDWLKPFTKKTPVDAKRPAEHKRRQHRPNVGNAHPRVGTEVPDGTNLQSLYNFPNCETPSCTYEDSPTDWTDLVDTYENKAWPSGYFIGTVFADKVNTYTSGTEMVVYPASCSDVSNPTTCTVTETAQSGWTIDYVHVYGYNFGEAMTAYKYIMSIPDTTNPAEEYVIAFKDIGSSSYTISAAMAIDADPNVIYWTPPAGNALDTVGLPNCVAPGCTYHSTYTEFNAYIADIEQELVPGGKFVAYIDIASCWNTVTDTLDCNGLTIGYEAYDSYNVGSVATVQPDFSSWTVISSAVDVALTSDASSVSSAWFMFVFEVPSSWTASDWEGYVRVKTTDSSGSNKYFPRNSDSPNLGYITVPVAAEFTGGGNSGEVQYVTSEDAFFDDVGENCFELIQTYLNVDFTEVTSPVDSPQEGGYKSRKINDYIAVQVTMDPDETWSSGSMTGGTMLKNVGWQCADSSNCPVTEVARLWTSPAQVSIMLKTWDHGAPYIEVGDTFRLGFALVDVYDTTPFDPLEYSEWVGFTMTIDSGSPLSCPDYSVYDGDSFNTAGGGGNSGELSPATTFSAFQSDVQTNLCYNALYAIANDVITMSFTTVVGSSPVVGHDTGPSDPYDHDHVTNLGVVQRKPYDFLSFAVSYDDDYLSIGWMCKAVLNCPVTEVARYNADDGLVLIVLQVSELTVEHDTFSV